MGRFEGALQAFGNACQELEDSPENFNIRLEILAELASSVPKEKISGQLLIYLAFNFSRHCKGARFVV